MFGQQVLDRLDPIRILFSISLLMLYEILGFHDENSTKSSSSLNLNGADPWGTCLFAFLEKDRVLTQCSNAVAHSWPIVFTRINSLFSVVDPT